MRILQRLALKSRSPFKLTNRWPRSFVQLLNVKQPQKGTTTTPAAVVLHVINLRRNDVCNEHYSHLCNVGLLGFTYFPCRLFPPSFKTPRSKQQIIYILQVSLILFCNPKFTQAYYAKQLPLWLNNADSLNGSQISLKNETGTHRIWMLLSSPYIYSLTRSMNSTVRKLPNVHCISRRKIMYIYDDSSSIFSIIAAG